MEINTLKPKQHIPHILHQIWTWPQLPNQYIRFQDSWKRLNPTFEYRLWSWDDIYAFMETQSQDALELFYSYPMDIQRIDMARYFILHDIGGLYADMDVECLKPFSCWLDGHYATFGEYRDGNKICNAMMASMPGHIIFKKIIQELPDAYERSLGKLGNAQHVLISTGRELITPIIFEHRDRCTIVPTKYWYPYEYEDRDIGYSLNYPEAYAKHYWNRGW